MTLSQRNYPPLHSLSSEARNLSLSLYQRFSLYGYQGSLITSLLTQNTTESLSAASIHFTDYCENSLEILRLLKRLLVLESQIGYKVRTNWSNHLGNTDCGKNYPRLDTDGLPTNCPEENFAQLELDLFPGLP